MAAQAGVGAAGRGGLVRAAWLRPALATALLLLPIVFVPAELWHWELVWSAGAGIQSLASFAAIFAIAAYALGLLMRFLNLPSGANAALFGVGAYASGIVIERLGWGFWPALLVAVAAAAVVGVGVGLLSLRTTGLAFLMITIALGELIVLVLRNWEGLTNGPLGLFVTEPPSPAPGAGVDSRLNRYYVALAFLYVTIFLIWRLSRSRFGKRLVAIRDNAQLVRSLGVSAFSYKLGCLVLSAAITGAAGHLYLIHLKAITPELFVPFAFIPVFLMVVMGGLGTLAGPAVGAWLVIFLPEWFAPLGLEDPTRQQLVFGALLIVFMLLAPMGIAGAFGALLDRFVPKGSVPGRQAVRSRLATLGWTQRQPRSKPGLASKRRPPVEHPNGEVRGLVLEGLTRSFGAVRALDAVSLTVEPGEIVGVIGPNGSGKTTLLNCVSGFIPPSAGRVLWNGAEISGKRPEAIARRGLVRTFQQPMAFGTYTVREHCELMWGVRDTPRPAGHRLDSSRVEGVLALLRLEDVQDVPASDLSYGQIRKLGIAVALATQLPQLLMLDEPAAGLSTVEGTELRDSLLEIRQAGLTLVVVDHDMAFLMPMCDRLIVLDAGAKIAQGSPSEIQQDPRVIAAYLGERYARRAASPAEPAS